jgi:serine/threonine-protein kinase
MSPEQVQGGPVDNRSDLYSVGVMLYEMVTGAKPITGDSSWAIMNAHVSQIPRAPAALNNSVPASLSLAILKALEKKPADRYQTAAEFAEILKSVRARFEPGARRSGSGDATVAFAMPQDKERENQPQEPAHPEPLPTPPSDPKLSTPRATALPAAGASRFDPKELDQVKRALAVYVGPMARIIVDRTAKKANSWQQLYELLSAEVPAGEERRRFLATRTR